VIATAVGIAFLLLLVRRTGGMTGALLDGAALGVAVLVTLVFAIPPRPVLATTALALAALCTGIGAKELATSPLVLQQAASRGGLAAVMISAAMGTPATAEGASSSGSVD
jgi:hypothetical protein